MLRVTPERESQRAAREVWRIERAVRRERVRRTAERGASPVHSLAVNTRALRLVLGMTQEALANRAGVARSYIAMVEGARIKGPSPDTLAPLARSLGTTAAKLLASPLPET
jgi:DNA-binding XRE family transcriptional regulator